MILSSTFLLIFLLSISTTNNQGQTEIKHTLLPLLRDSNFVFESVNFCADDDVNDHSRDSGQSENSINLDRSFKIVGRDLSEANVVIQRLPSCRANVIKSFTPEDL